MSSCLNTSRHNVPKTSVGTVVVDVEAERPLRSGLRSVLGRLWSRLLSSLAGEIIPSLSICSVVKRLPQILSAESMPSEASESISIKEINSQVQKHRALLGMLLEATKLTGIIASQCQSVITHMRLQLTEIVLSMQVFTHFE